MKRSYWEHWFNVWSGCSSVYRRNGYWLAEPFWNKGIMSEVVSRFTDFAFEKFELNRIFAEPYTNNTASVRVLEKLDSGLKVHFEAMFLKMERF